MPPGSDQVAPSARIIVRHSPGQEIDQRKISKKQCELVIAEWDTKTKPPDTARAHPPAALVERVRRLRALLKRIIDSGRRPGYFWPPQRDRQLRELMDAGKFQEANGLLDRALQDYRRGPPGRTPPPQPPRR